MIVNGVDMVQQEALESMRESDIRPAYPVFGDINEAIERESLEKLEAFEFKQNQFFKRFRAIFREDVDYFNSHQWSTQDVMGLLPQNRKPYVFNQIRPFVEAALGEQRLQRTDMHAVPLNPVAEAFAGQMNHYLRWATQRNQWGDTASDIFRDGFVGGVGVCGLSLDYNDPGANVVMERCYPLEFMWDIETGRNSTLDNNDWLWHGKWTGIGAAIDEYPDAKEVIRSTITSNDRLFIGYDILRRPRVNALTNELVPDYQYTGLDYFTRDLVFRRELYHRRYERRWVIRDLITNSELDFPTEAAANDGMRQLFAFYMREDIRTYFQIERPLISEPRVKNVPYVDKFVFFGNRLIDFSTARKGRFPYKFYIPEYYDGELTSRIEHAKPLQRFVNRIMMFLDEIAGGVKGGTVVNKSYLDDSWTEGDIRKEAVKTNPVYIVDKPPEDYPLEQFIKSTAAPVNGQMAGELLGVIKEDLFGLFGTANTVGKAQFAGQSGVSAEGAIAQASIRNIPLIDKWRYFQQQIGEELIYFSQFLEPHIKMYISNEYGEPEIASFADAALGMEFTPEDLEYSIHIAEKVATQSEQEAMRGELAMIMQTAPETYPVLLPKWLKATNMDPRDRREVEQALQAQEQFKMEMATRQAQLEERERLWKIEKETIQLQLKDKELNIMAAAQQAPKISLSGKIGEIPPSAEATLLSATGNINLEADPLGIMQDRAMHTVMEQEKKDIEHAHYNALTPWWEKQKGATAKKGTSTPKDSAQRQNR